MQLSNVRQRDHSGRVPVTVYGLGIRPCLYDGTGLILPLEIHMPWVFLKRKEKKEKITVAISGFLNVEGIFCLGIFLGGGMFAACESSQASDQISATAETRATALTSLILTSLCQKGTLRIPYPT